jgi:hypothetical protein
MSFEDDVELISGYNDWVLEQKRLLSDLTPERYLAERMRDDAADRVIKAIELIEGYGNWDEVNGRYTKLMPKISNIPIREIELILRGDL